LGHPAREWDQDEGSARVVAAVEVMGEAVAWISGTSPPDRDHEGRPMNSEDPSGGQKQTEDPRVRFAAERTLLAWMRTGLALMGFGFVVARFGLFLREIAAAGQVAARPPSTGWSLWIGTGLISLGVAVSLVAAFEYFRFGQLSKRGEPYTPRTAFLAVAVAFILAILGIVMAIYLVVLSN
jgi:putative membrane protein